MKILYVFLLALFAGVTANAQCVALFSGAQVSIGNNLLNVNFTNGSSYGTPFTGQYKIYRITYGDGSSNSAYGTAIQSHIYSSPGTYTVGLKISSMDTSTLSLVCTDSTTLFITVSYPACGTVISASGTAASRSFNATNPAGTPGISYSWSFGDGGTATGSSPGHTYTSSGTYTVTCTSTVGTPASCTYVNTMTVYIAVPPPPLTCSTLLTAFSASVAAGGSNVSVSNTSTMIGYPYNTNARWDYGDGTTAYGLYPSLHSYAATGVYTIKLIMEWRDSVTSTVLCRDSTTRSVTITTLSPANIDGYVWYDTAIYGPTTFKVWLIQFDPATNILSAVDSQIVTSSPWLVSYFSFVNKPASNYLLKAAVSGGPTSGTGIIPTYHISSATWSSATTVNALPGSSTYTYIQMLTGTVTSGPGFVGGNVSLGANKGTSGGVSGLLVFLYNASMQMVQMAYTNSNGDFSFSNIPAGSYTVYPEQLNYATTPAAVSITGGSSSATGINFNQDDVKMNIKPHLLAVGSIPGNVVSWSIYPNPASSELNIFWKGVSTITSSVMIRDVAGKTVMQAKLYGMPGGQQKIDISALRPGLYFVQGTGALSGAVSKLTVE